MFLLLSLGGGKGPTPRQGAAPRVEEDTRGGGGGGACHSILRWECGTGIEHEEGAKWGGPVSPSGCCGGGKGGGGPAFLPTIPS